jgi:uncharacterized RDD family membrane protein YckC
MKKVLFRVFAYLIDAFILGLIMTILVTFIPFFNNDKITELAESNTSEVKEYTEFSIKLDSYLEDSKITNEEFDSIKEHFPILSDELKDLVDKDTSKEEVVTKITNRVKKDMITLEYKTSRLSLARYILEFILTIIYLGYIQFVLKGQTLGKKLLRLYVVNDSNEVPSLKVFLIRSLFTSTVIFSLINSIVSLCVKNNVYFNVYKYLSGISTLYVVGIFAFILFRDDQKGLHDLLLHTHIKLLNKDNTEYVQEVFNEGKDEKDSN